jgi:phosphatidylserine/phosphatidylglycerophosphate/cardiolipin synthase-like enzyme
MIDTFFLRDVRHGGPADQPTTVARKLADFVATATATVDIAIYDFRLGTDLAAIVVRAIVGAAQRGVGVRIAYDAGKPADATEATFARTHADPAPPGTLQFVEGAFAGTPVRVRPISAPSGQLMHSKYVIVDTESVWTGSTNFTDDAWTLQENNILTCTVPAVAKGYARDFDQLWTAGTISGTGKTDAGTVTDGEVTIGWDFAPADGTAIDRYLTSKVTTANRLVIATMVLTSHPLLAALAAAVERGITVSGVYDAGQMGPIASDWAHNPHDAAVVANWRTVSARLVGKPSTPYTPDGPHDFMHNKVMVVDDEVVTGSYNFSANAQRNAENQVRLDDPELVDRYVTYIDAIAEAYR